MAKKAQGLTMRQAKRITALPARLRGRARVAFAQANQPQNRSRPAATRSAGRPRRSSAPSRRASKSGHGLGQLFNPFVTQAPIPSLSYEGPAVPITTNSVNTLTTTLGKILCVTNVGSSNMCAWEVDAAGSNVVRAGSFLGSAGSAGGPTSCRAMKAGILMKNVTATLSVAGTVRVLKTNRRLEFAAAPSAFTAGNYTTLRDDIANHPDTSIYSAADFVHGKCFFTTPDRKSVV